MVIDLGTDTDAIRIDYPDKAAELGAAITDGRAERGVLVCGSGVGASVAACKIAGIRAAICHDVYSAHQGVEHDDMNVLCLGSEVIGPSLASDLVTRLPRREVRRRRALRRETGEGRRRWRRGCSMAESRLDKVAERGQSVWFDTLSRDLVHSGELERMMKEDAVTGVTSNPTIFQKALSQGDAYDEQLKELLAETDDATEIFFGLALDDIRDACDVLRAVHDKAPWDGFVSMEVLPGARLRHGEDLRRRRAGSRQEVDRPNLFVKIPATKPGLPAIEDCDRARHVDQHHADLLPRALQGRRRGVPPRARAARRRRRRPVARSSSVASFFVSRVDTEADKRLEALGNEKLQGKLAIANAKLAYEHFLETFQGERWEYLQEQGRAPAAPALGVDLDEEPGLPRRDVRRGADRPRHREHDAARDDRGVPGSRRGARRHRHGGRRRGARSCFAELAAAGVDYDDVVDHARAGGRAEVRRLLRRAPRRRRSAKREAVAA